MPFLIRRFAVVAVVVALAGSGKAAFADGDPVRGKQLAYTCLGCHGIENYKNTYPTYSVPKLGGQHPEYIVAALRAYQSGERSHGTMHAQASTMSEQDLADVAAFLAGKVVQPGAKPVGTAPEAAQLCVACHGNEGVGIVPDYPTLSGQHADYLERALVDYKKGGRKNAIMGGFIGTLTDADFKAVAEYYSKQKPGLYTVPHENTRFDAP
jgi:cytochrome c553